MKNVITGLCMHPKRIDKLIWQFTLPKVIDTSCTLIFCVFVNEFLKKQRLNKTNRTFENVQCEDDITNANKGPGCHVTFWVSIHLMAVVSLFDCHFTPSCCVTFWLSFPLLAVLSLFGYQFTSWLSCHFLAILSPPGCRVTFWLSFYLSFHLLAVVSLFGYRFPSWLSYHFLAIISPPGCRVTFWISFHLLVVTFWLSLHLLGVVLLFGYHFTSWRPSHLLILTLMSSLTYYFTFRLSCRLLAVSSFHVTSNVISALPCRYTADTAGDSCKLMVCFTQWFS